MNTRVNRIAHRQARLSGFMASPSRSSKAFKNVEYEGDCNDDDDDKDEVTSSSSDDEMTA